MPCGYFKYKKKSNSVGLSFELEELEFDDKEINHLSILPINRKRNSK
jgi:hypothetical protein